MFRILLTWFPTREVFFGNDPLRVFETAPHVWHLVYHSLIGAKVAVIAGLFEWWFTLVLALLFRF
jgi:hypothetical protein